MPAITPKKAKAGTPKAKTPKGTPKAAATPKSAKASKKVEPTPPPPMAVEESSSEEESSEDEVPVVATPKNGTKTTPGKKAPAPVAVAEEESDEDDSEEEEESSEEGTPAAAPVAAEDSDDDDESEEDDDDDDEEEDSDDDEEEMETAPAAAVAEDDDDEDSDEEDDDDDDDDEEEASSDSDSKKRKAPATDEPSKKKMKTADGAAKDADKKSLFIYGFETELPDKVIEDFLKKGGVTALGIRRMSLKKIAYADVANDEQVELALELNDTEYEGTKIRVDRADSKGSGGRQAKPGLFVRNVAAEASIPELEKMFKGCTEVVRAAFPDGTYKRWAIVRYDEGSVKLMEQHQEKFNGHEFHGEELVVEKSVGKEKQDKNRQQRTPHHGGGDDGEPTRTLIVKSLSWNVDSDSLKDAFDAAVSARVCTTKSDFGPPKSRGFGFIEFGSIEEASAAKDSMQGHRLDGREIMINFASDTPPSGGRGGFRGGRGGGGFRGGRGGGFGGRGGRGGFGDRGRGGPRGRGFGGRGRGRGGRGGFGSDSSPNVKKTFDDAPAPVVEKKVKKEKAAPVADVSSPKPKKEKKAKKAKVASD